jgi:hypothetical protein
MDGESDGRITLKILNQNRCGGFHMKRLTRALAVAAIAISAPALAQQPTPKPETLFTNVSVFDSVNEKRIKNANVLVEGNLIRSGLDQEDRRQGWHRHRLRWPHIDAGPDRRALARAF